jgi:DNA topoisomerase-1
VKIIQFKQRPRVICLDPTCETRKEPEVIVGKCPTGDGGDLVVRRSPNTLKRYVRCTNYDECGTSYPLPQSGEIEPTDETCECGEHGTPKIIVHTKKGPWKICINPECPLKAPDKKGNGAAKPAARRGRGSAARGGARKTGGGTTRRRSAAGEGAA